MLAVDPSPGDDREIELVGEARQVVGRPTGHDPTVVNVEVMLLEPGFEFDRAQRHGGVSQCVEVLVGGAGQTESAFPDHHAHVDRCDVSVGKRASRESECLYARRGEVDTYEDALVARRSRFGTYDEYWSVAVTDDSFGGRAEHALERRMPAPGAHDHQAHGDLGCVPGDLDEWMPFPGRERGGGLEVEGLMLEKSGLRYA